MVKTRSSARPAKLAAIKKLKILQQKKRKPTITNKRRKMRTKARLSTVTHRLFPAALNNTSNFSLQQPNTSSISDYTTAVIEPYNINLNLTDCSRNIDKFMRMKVVKTVDSSKFWFVQSWGRNGTTGQRLTKGFGSLLEATKFMEAKFKTKTGIEWANQATAMSNSGKYEIQRRLREANAGMSVNAGSIAVSLMWDNMSKKKRNDLDLWVVSPSGERIGYNHKRSACGGELDVDCQQSAFQPVENIVWKDKAPEGKFEIWVHNYSYNHVSWIPFRVSAVVDGGKMEMIDCVMPAESGKWVHIKNINYRHTH